MSKEALVRFVDRLLDDVELQAAALVPRDGRAGAFFALSELAAERGYHFSPGEAAELYGIVSERFAGPAAEY